MIALKMLIGDRAKYLGIIMGITFASLLITQQLAIFNGLMSRTYGAISDVGLPEQDGYDLIRKIRALPAAQGGDVPAIALTGYVSVQDQTQALSAGYHEHLPKPVDTDRLIGLLLNLKNAPRRSSLTVGIH